MAVTRANVEAAKAFIRNRLGNPYVYGGALSISNPRQGTDCSEVWQTVLELVWGRYVQGRQAEGATTESYRPKEMGGPIPYFGVGPFGTIVVPRYADIPANAVAKIAFHHGPGGGANSHMWGELDGMLIESAGSKGLVTAPQAWPVNHSYANAWAYLPGPIVEDGTPAAPLPIYLGRNYENSGLRVLALQRRLNEVINAGLVEDGEFGPATEAAVKAYQRSVGITVDGVAGPETLGRLGLSFAPPSAPTADAVRILARATGLTEDRARGILPTLSEGLRLADCTNPNRIAMFIAQTGHESDGYNTTEEYASGAAYEGRCSDLGNCQPGDGVRFKGRGWIQVTGRGNYTEFSRWAHSKGLVPTPTHFVDRPTELADLRWAGISAAWYWTVARPDINALSDRRDLETVTRRINGGLTNIDDRRARYNRALAVGDDLMQLLNEGEDLLPGLSADESREVLFLLRILAHERFSNRSMYAESPDDKDTAAGRALSAHAFGWDERVEGSARLGDQWAVDRIRKAAAGKLWGVHHGGEPDEFLMSVAQSRLDELVRLGVIDDADPESTSPARRPGEKAVEASLPKTESQYDLCALGAVCKLNGSSTRCAIDGGACALVANPDGEG